MYTCDSCLARPATWTATFPDGVGFDICDRCGDVVDDRVQLTRSFGIAGNSR